MKKNWLFFVAGTAAGALLSDRLLHRRGKELPLPVGPQWQGWLAKEIGEVPAGVLISKARVRYQELMLSRPHFDQPALRNHVENRILPTLALYQAFLAETGSSERAKEWIGLLLNAKIQSKFAPLRFISHQPWFFSFFRRALSLSMALEYPSPGWETEWIQNDEQAIAFNMHGCLYKSILEGYGTPELTPIFCQADVAGMEGMGGLRFERTTTQALGGAVCDFCYRKTA
jgi:hypothetical protein